MSQLARTSQVLNRARLIVARSKSTYVYETDKTFGQRWIDKRVAKIKEQQKLYGAEDGLPIWWKTGKDRAITTVVFAATVASFVISLSNLYKYSNGTL